jgi:heptosyltransferase-3
VWPAFVLNAIPPFQQLRRIVLVNPTRYLGNLLIAGGLIQAFAAHCAARGIAFTLVVDAPFAALLRPALAQTSLLSYPRGAIKQAGAWGKLKLYVGFVRKLRNFKADLAFNIEEDSTSDRLTRWSGAHYRLGCSVARHRRGYEQVLPVSFVERPVGRRHRWYSFMEVFAALGMDEPEPGYLHFPPTALPAPPLEPLARQGFAASKPYAVLHAGATREYKKWPRAYFAQLAQRLTKAGLQVVFIGAGHDAEATAQVLSVLAQNGDTQGVFDATNQFTLPELGGFLREARCMVGNDSGPFHLATALGVKGVVIYGPTDAGLWRPLGDAVRVLQHASQCKAECSRKHCLFDHACLKSISADDVMAALRDLAVVD